jgi:hypothetical protein
METLKQSVPTALTIFILLQWLIGVLSLLDEIQMNALWGDLYRPTLSVFSFHLRNHSACFGLSHV